jgi:hypothetical protein
MQESSEQWQESSGSNYINSIELHTTENLANLAPTVRKAIAEVEPNLTVINVLTFDELVSLNFNTERMVARLTSASALWRCCLLVSDCTASRLIRWLDGPAKSVSG